MKVTITVETETAVGNKSKSVVFKDELTVVQLNSVNELAVTLAEWNK